MKSAGRLPDFVFMFHFSCLHVSCPPPFPVHPIQANRPPFPTPLSFIQLIPRNATMMIETLESRQLLSATLTVEPVSTTPTTPTTNITVRKAGGTQQEYYVI